MCKYSFVNTYAHNDARPTVFFRLCISPLRHWYIRLPKQDNRSLFSASSCININSFHTHIYKMVTIIWTRVMDLPCAHPHDVLPTFYAEKENEHKKGYSKWCSFFWGISIDCLPKGTDWRCTKYIRYISMYSRSKNSPYVAFLQKLWILPLAWVWFFFLAVQSDDVPRKLMW